ncbi:MAG: DUF1848 domain-containing protein [Nitrospirae bacterium]|nr:DUF1848 domain-containing protein [Nitrospirota bacterium]
MIVSVSYRTDIPAFYGEWFMNRLRAGFCMTVNPYGGQVSRVDLTPETVGGFVFWTRNVGPFLGRLDEVRRMGFPFVVSYTITGYPRALESSVVDPGRSIDLMKSLRDAYGPKAAVWRYDTIVFSSLTPADFHRRNFETLARSLEGATDEAVVSFAQIYKKTKRNMDAAAGKFGFAWEDPAEEVKLALARDLAEIAGARGMRLSVCGQRPFIVPGSSDARCIDPRRLSEVAGRPIEADPRGHRPDCGCAASRDIGEYDTCPHGCVYCYAVQTPALARRRHRQHDPKGEFLIQERQIENWKL